jgi:hypothetical protein
MTLDHSAADERIVEAQVGRTLRGRWAVARRCHLGVPMVIENHPRFSNGQPFPTLFWLTCPLLAKRAGTLEAEGYMARLTERSAADPRARARLGGALRRYRARRDRHEVIPDRGAPPGGGPGKIKCLHAHLAHELADPPNPVGALALAAGGFPDCRAPCVRAES